MTERPNKMRSALRRTGVVLSLVFTCMALLIWLIPGLEAERFVADNGTAAPVLFVALKASTIVLPASGVPLYLLAPRLFGAWPGILLCVIGDLIGYAVLYALARSFGLALLQSLLPDSAVSRVTKATATVGHWRGFVTARLLFFLAPEIPSMAAGMAGLPFGSYVAVSVPLIVATAATLALPGILIVSGRALALAMTGLGALLLCVHFVRQWRVNRHRRRGEAAMDESGPTDSSET